MKSVIVLTKSAEYWDEISTRRAILKILKHKATIFSHNGRLIYTTKDGEEIWLPLIIQLSGPFNGYKYKSENVHYSDEAVFFRDDNYCQYWHNHKFEDGKLVMLPEPVIYKCTENDRTTDHILPVSRGGKSSFLNVVCACKYCNEIIKKNRTPEEAGMRLIRPPFEPKNQVGERVRRKFVFNPNKPSHREYVKLVYNGIWK